MLISKDLFKIVTHYARFGNYYVSARRNIWWLFVNMFEAREVYEAHEVYVSTYEGHSWLYKQKRKDFEAMYNIFVPYTSHVG